MVVECAFGRLKERFRTLKVVMSEKSLGATLNNVVACMVLHNLLVGFKDPLFTVSDAERDRNCYNQPTEKRDTKTESSPVIREIAQNRRTLLMNMMYNSR